MNNTILNCYVVDDSSIQRLAIVKMIENHPNLKLIGEFSNAIETKAAIKDQKVDLIFLDVEMPILTGFDLLDDITEKPGVIFVTGQTKYAFKAFDYAAIDYLQKPIKKDRFLYAVERALLAHKLRTEMIEDRGEFIFVKSNLKKRKVYLKELKYIQALGDYVKLITEDDSLVVLSTMKSFENELPSDEFLRIHKSYIVNLRKIEKFNSKAVELGSEVLPLSRNRKSELIDALSQF
ncbi:MULTISPECIES: LytR/AlgR family response regulator transcription factor [Nonlabens]|uniref:Transcriptional regulator n=6 Tax=Nonlabens ulvanivorans TaxID=906888 RepID=A0A084K001_NONUL|nr:LytTR family DNA-binding domain-containing protein [Nonlabens ulvanivorans]KEZ94535.1 transcriptional regulator [Nonlabens ulvanivorans]PRX13428.1 LytTR family two component transcriptional regulator [Nonlabens ulvanivorans]WOI23689.1 LytTR family DNA-binding domain-containing protein [Nonlabens ulvanivorans]GAL01595.1 two-component system response regulator protein [Nonlabens ulvanivorans]GAL75623.1 two-component system response regulator protein [Nonlabens ulvanivorans]